MTSEPGAGTLVTILQSLLGISYLSLEWKTLFVLYSKVQRNHEMIWREVQKEKRSVCFFPAEMKNGESTRLCWVTWTLNYIVRVRISPSMTNIHGRNPVLPSPGAKGLIPALTQAQTLPAEWAFGYRTSHSPMGIMQWMANLFTDVAWRVPVHGLQVQSNLTIRMHLMRAMVL